MHFLRSANTIVLIGGRRLGEQKSSDINAGFIKDTHVLNMRTLDWSVIKFSGFDLTGIYNFASCIHEGSIYIFGGTVDPHQQSKKLIRIKDVTEEQAQIFEF